MNRFTKYSSRLEKFLQTGRGKRFINFAYSIGAAIVILGAMFKLLHLPFGNELLFVGMITEVIVFTLSAFDTPIRDYSWEKVYPILSDNETETKEALKSTYSKADNMNHPTMGEELLEQERLSVSTDKGSTLYSSDYIGRMEHLNLTIEEESQMMAKHLREINRIYARMLNAISKEGDE